MSHSAVRSMLLSDLLGTEVRSVGGEVLGHLVDMTVEFGDDRPVVRRVAVGRRRRVGFLVQWDAVTSFEQGDIQVSTSAEQGGESGSQKALSEHELFLARDVLDTQIVDVAGKRLARVSDVVIERSGAVLRVASVEVGAAGVWRRIGMGRLVQNRRGHMVDWSDLHLTSARGHALQLAAPAAVVHRLAATELASVVAHLPTARAVEVLDAVPASAAAGALSASHPGVGARLLHTASRANRVVDGCEYACRRCRCSAAASVTRYRRRIVGGRALRTRHDAQAPPRTSRRYGWWTDEQRGSYRCCR